MASPDIVGSPEFTEFLIEAKQHGYGAEGNERTTTESGAYVGSYAAGPFRYVDNYVGGNPYAGFEHVSYDAGDGHKPVWAMSYYETQLDMSGSELFAIMKKVLIQPDPDLPLRGPKEWQDGDVRYWTQPVSRGAELEKFDVEEFIAIGNRRLYTARFMGGLVNHL